MRQESEVSSSIFGTRYASRLDTKSILTNPPVIVSWLDNWGSK